MIIVFSSMNTIPMDNFSISTWVDSKSLLLCILWHVCLYTSFVDPPANKWMLQSTMRRFSKQVIHCWATLFLQVNLIFGDRIYAIAIIVIWYAGIITQLLSVQILLFIVLNVEIVILSAGATTQLLSIQILLFITVSVEMTIW